MPLSSDKHIVDQKVREALRNYRAQPSGRVWNKVSQQLSNSSEKRSLLRGKSALMLALLFICGGTFLTLSTIHTPEKISYSTPANNLPPNLNKEETMLTKGENATVKNSINNAAVIENKGIPSTTIACLIQSPSNSRDEMELVQSSLPATDNEIIATRISNELSMVSSQKIENADIKLIESNYILAASTRVIPEKENYFKNYHYPKIVYSPHYYKANVKGAYAGFGQNINSTWILDREAIKNKTMKYQPTFGTALMVQGGYNFNNRWGVEGAWVIHSGEGQKYQYIPVYSRTTSLVYYQKHIAFDYMQVPVMVRYKVQGWSGLLQVPFFVNYSLGAQYGRMISYSVDETKEKVSEGHLFRRNEYAAVASVDYDFLTRGAAFFTLGLRASLGSSLFIKDTPEDLEFDQPHNFVIGIHGALNFSLQKKQLSEIK